MPAPNRFAARPPAPPPALGPNRLPMPGPNRVAARPLAPPAPPAGPPPSAVGVVGPPPRLALRIGLAVAVLVVLVGSAVVALRTPQVPEAPASQAGPVLFDPVPPAPQPVPSVATATTLDIPRLQISRSQLVELGVDGAGVLIPPTSTATAGWYTGSAVPGQVGPTVIAGHVDSYAGPGIFFRLDTLRDGDLVTVGRSDGVAVRYRVTDVTTVPKDAFPTRQVYGPTPGSELRLITCGGEFDHTARRYLNNVIVSAVYAS